MWRENLSNEELDFLGENCLIEINPHFRKEEIRLICVIITNKY